MATTQRTESNMRAFLLQNLTTVFPLLVGAMELAAACVYAWVGQWWLAMAWACYALACVGLAMGSR